jgi:hypothetical protein
MENQLYRIEIHRRGGGWDRAQQAVPGNIQSGRENGSVAFPIYWLEGGLAEIERLASTSGWG